MHNYVVCTEPGKFVLRKTDLTVATINAALTGIHPQDKGYMELVPAQITKLPKEFTLICNESGKIYGYPYTYSLIGDWLCGKFIICTTQVNVDDEADFTGLSKEQVYRLQQHLHVEFSLEN